MNGIHDVGGMHGFGQVHGESDEPVFHAEWERRLFGLRMSLLGRYTLDEARRASETMDPGAYLTSPYYERWLASLEFLLVEKGYLTQAELEQMVAEYEKDPDAPVPRRENPALVERLLRMVREGGSPLPEAMGPRRFREGDRIRARNMHPPGHNRLPRYARGKPGKIARLYPAFFLPDTHAYGGQEAEYLYCVSFTGEDLWGSDADPSHLVHLDLWESYLEPLPDVTDRAPEGD